MFLFIQFFQSVGQFVVRKHDGGFYYLVKIVIAIVGGKKLINFGKVNCPLFSVNILM